MYSPFSFRLFVYIVGLILLLPCLTLALDVTLAWDKNRDEVSGYRLYYGRESRNYSTVIDVGEDTSHRITGLEDDRTYFFAVTAYNSSNSESDYSGEISYPYASPVNLLINSGFETGSLDGWYLDKGLIAVTGESANAGSYGIKMFKKSTLKQSFSTIKGNTYYVSAKIRIDRQIKKTSWGGITIRIRNESGGLLAKSPVVKIKNSPIGGWVEVRFSFLAKGDSSQLIFRNTGQFEASADDFVVN